MRDGVLRGAMFVNQQRRTGCSYTAICSSRISDLDPIHPVDFHIERLAVYPGYHYRILIIALKMRS